MAMAAVQHTSSFPLGYPSWLEGIPQGVWVETALPETTSVVIIGGGLAGIATAYYLAAAGIDVVLLEQGRLCDGSSGRNGGFIAPGWADYESVVGQFGPGLASEMMRFELESTEALSGLVQELGIDADLRFGGHVALALDADGVNKIRRSAELLSQHGFPGTVWEQEECRGQTQSPSFLGGLFRPNGGTLSPGKLALGLAQAANNLGAQIKTYTHVRALQRENQGRVTVFTSLGNITAEHIVFTTNTVEAPLLPALAGAGIIQPVRGQVLATRPLDYQIWTLGFATIDGLVYWHQDAEGRIVIGGMRHVTPGMEVGVTDVTQTNPEIGQALRRFLPDQFPGVVPQELEVTHEWTGVMAVPRDGLPLVGHLVLPSYHSNTWLLVGLGGHGMPVFLGAARALSDMIQGETPTNIVDAFRPSTERFGGSV